MFPSDAIDNEAICPQCRTSMVHVAVTPHPVVRSMQRNTFVCYTCKRTRTYMLPWNPEAAIHENAAQRHRPADCLGTGVFFLLYTNVIPIFVSVRQIDRRGDEPLR